MVETLEDLRSIALTCERCALSATRIQVVFGEGDPTAGLLFIGEAPGAEEDRRGVPFVGRSGQLLDRLMFEEMGRDRTSCYIANVVKCRPPDNRNPQREEIDACRPYLEEQIRHMSPKVIVTLGNFSTRLLLDTKQGITSLRGHAYPSGESMLVPTLHPAAVLRGGAQKMVQMRADLVLARQLLEVA